MTFKKTPKIFFWSPMLSNVGTTSAIIGMAESLKKFGSYDIYILNIFGEFSSKKNSELKYINFLNINHILPTTGIGSKIFIIVLSLLSIPFLFFQVMKHRPSIIITGLVGYIPCMLKFFFKNLIIINSIQGYPKLNFTRKIIWKIFYSKSDYIFTMTDKTKEKILSFLKYDKNKIFTVQNPILSRSIKIKSKEKIDIKDEFIFKKNVYCAIGRLTKQKNFIELLRFIKKICKNDKINNFNVIILGEGEKRNELEKYISKNNLSNCYLLGYKKNPYSYLSRSKLYVSTSSWEDPGHTLIEAGFLNIPILSSNCPNGPEEIIIDKLNGIKYELGNYENFSLKLKNFINLDNQTIFSLKKNMKKKIINYSSYRFFKKFSKIINLNEKI